MKQIFFFRKFLVLLLVMSSLHLMSQPVTLPRTPSPAASVSQTIGISTVNVKYSRPSVKGREVWGALVPYGWNIQAPGINPAPWRAGANENTVLSLSHPAKIEGQEVPAGDYGLFFTINKDNNSGELILSKDYKSWGSFFYDPKQDQMRANIQLRTIPQTELLTYDFSNVTKNSAELDLNWEKKQFPVKVEFDVDNIVMNNAVQELKGGIGFGWQSYASAANYALQNKINYDQALKWIDQAIALNASFNTMSVKSKLLNAMGKNAEGDKIMKDAIAVSTENELNLYGYQLMNQGKQDEAIQIFILNTQRHPKSANTWDSLGEAYATKGDKKNAIINFKKSLSMNPPANVKANSEKFLHQLGAM